MPEAVKVNKFVDIISENALEHKSTHINILKDKYAKK